MCLCTRVAIVALMSLLLPTSALAWGYGIYVEYLNADGWTKDDGTRVDLDNDGFAFGFEMDSSVALDRIFNYRLDAGIRYAEGEYDFPRDDDYDTIGIAAKNTFGFGLLRKKSVRLWVGPAIGIEINGRDADFTDHDAFEGRIGFGPELGVNFHTGKQVSIGLTAGYQYTWGFGTQTAEHYSDYYCSSSRYDCSDFPNFNSYEIREDIFSMKFSILLRTKGDAF